MASSSTPASAPPADAAAMPKLGLSVKQIVALREEFKAIDIDGDGQVTAEELWKYLDGEVAFEDVQAIIMAQDKDGNGKVSLDEFLANEGATTLE
ncbi:hypothetical protein FNF27_06458 [Cafeteria roenbergensis]|uniref:EF-hand domain-containing protein n=1 Tax=Cafeteria roenbergensis TaxID=33653 RepID=A0A5A8E4V8_CAFRO|nr:hypothetical protein FNF29_03583 [Cafeteria roenbergensis]KAA0165821.1 hypothetical protein FNF31_01798 [Cafeteria roenbergensis]KAA0170981.1 hypothetical protein FNF27_06458 [Cafeteria roenbergensis]|eukprot:KAA0152694.1 hypothetical protein FNF29_03583 [Cafeteria roenbergensis]